MREGTVLVGFLWVGVERPVLTILSGQSNGERELDGG